MQKKSSLITAMLAGGILLPLAAQTVLNFPELNKQGVNAKEAGMEKKGAQNKSVSSNLPLSDQEVLEAFGGTPAPRKVAMKDPFGPEDDTQYRYTGFNIAAGLNENGEQTGGLVNFNLQPFACDTVSSHSGVSPYSYVKGDKLNCILPTREWSGTYSTLQRTVYDANTLEYLDMFTENIDVTGPQSQAYAPYILSYDDRRDVIYCITFDYIDGIETYYLNIFDENDNKVKRLGALGTYQSGRAAKDNMTVRALCAGYGSLYALVRQDNMYLVRINPVTCEITYIGIVDVEMEYPYGVSPMIYDANEGYFTLNYYDLGSGTTYYKFGSWADATTNRINTTMLEHTPTGFDFFYERPEMSNTTRYENQLNDVDDFEVVYNADGDLQVSFTVPELPDFEWPNWGFGPQITISVDDTSLKLENLNPTTINLGDFVTATVPINRGENEWKTFEKGMVHTVTLAISQSQGIFATYRISKTLVFGQDAPAQVSNIRSEINGNEVTLSWDAPTESRFADFGTVLDPSSVIYTVIRNNDRKRVATGITETTCMDEIESDEFTAYTYSIYAESNGMRGLAAISPNVYGGTYLALPYVNNFDNINCLDGYSIFNVDNNGTYRTWQFNSVYFMVYSGWGDCDDWLITPPVRMNKGEIYEIKPVLDGDGYFEIFYGNEPTPEAMTVPVTVLRKTNDVEPFAYYISPEEDGEYYIGFHDYSVGMEAFWGMHSLKIDHAAATGAPGELSDAAFVPEKEGSYNGVVTAVMPATTVDGRPISALTSFRVYDENGKLLGSNDNVKPGEKADIALSADQGWNYFEAMAVNEEGEGYPVFIKKYIGTDITLPLKNLKATWGTEQNQMVLSWDEPTEGRNGGWIDPENLVYKIYQYLPGQYPDRYELGETTDTQIEVTILDNDRQDQYVVSVTAITSEGESDFANTSVVLGKPYTLPIVEPLGQDGMSVSPYITTTVFGQGGWTVDGEYYNDNVKAQNNDGVQLVSVNTGSGEGKNRIATPIIEFSGNNTPVLNIWLHHTEGMEAETYFMVEATTNGHDYEEICEPIYLSGNNGWQRHAISLSAVAGKKAQIGLVTYTPNGKDRVFADNYSIKEATGNDLAITGISATRYEKSGDTAKINVTVANDGAKEAKDYIVLFYVNDETVSEVDATESLAAGSQAVYTFELPVYNGNNGETTYYAEVLFDGDEDESNNISEKRVVELMTIDLPAPTNFALDEDTKEMTWDAPVVEEGRKVTLTFEETPAFITDDIEGWNTVDGDGHLTISFVQYYGNYWPYCNQPLAWMVWGNKEAGCPTAMMWAPYEGDHCLIAWGNYGLDADGHDNMNEPEDDWFISPEIMGGSDFSFMTLSNDLASVVEVLVSTTDRNPESFTQKVVSVDYPNLTEWREISCKLPEDAKYVALHVIANGFGIMVDNISYTLAHTPQLEGYNIYCNQIVEQFVEGTTANCQKGGYYAVSARYDIGESALTDYKSASVISISNGAKACNVFAGEGFITVRGAEDNEISIVNLQGVAYFNGKAEADLTVNVPADIYVVRVNDAAVKVVVR